MQSSILCADLNHRRYDDITVHDDVPKPDTFPLQPCPIQDTLRQEGHCALKPSRPKLHCCENLTQTGHSQTQGQKQGRHPKLMPVFALASKLHTTNTKRQPSTDRVGLCIPKQCMVNKSSVDSSSPTKSKNARSGSSYCTNCFKDYDINCKKDNALKYM